MSKKKGNKGKLERGISLSGAIALLLGSVVGAGIFVTIGPLTGSVGPAIILSFGLASIAPIFVALYNIQLAGVLPITGSDYVSSTRALSPSLGWLAGYCGIAASIVAIGLLGFAFGGFMQEIISAIPPLAMSFGVIIIFFLINLVGVRLTARVQLAMLALLVILPLIIFIVGGWPEMQAGLHRPFFPKGIKPMLVMTVAAAYSYVGITTITGWAGEVKNARRNVPLALGISIGVTVVLFMLVSWVLTGVVPWQETGEAVAAVPEAAMSFLPDWLGSFVMIGAIFAILTSINGTILVNSRLLVALARDDVLPSYFGRINDRFNTPHLALLFSMVGGLIGASLGFAIEQYAIIQVMLMLTFHIIVGTAVFYLPDKMPKLYEDSPFKFGGFLRWLSWIGILVVGVLFIIFGMTESWIIAPFYFIVLGIGIVYWFIRRYYLRQRGVKLEERMKDLTPEEKEEIKGA